MSRHTLLARQLKKSFGETAVPPELAAFLYTVEQAYRQSDDDRAMLERSLELSSRELLQANAELRATLESTKRIQAQMIRSEKMSAVGQLAAGVAHEINNPLSVILGFSQSIVRHMAPDHRDAASIRHIEREALRCKALVQDLLAFSRMETPELVPMCINEAVNGSLSLVHAQARTKQVEVRTELGEDLCGMMGQANQIQQVVINLATNAIDAMPGGGVLTLTTGREEGWIVLRVRDTGTGIPADVLPRMFEPFYTTKAIGKGTGLGLSLAYEITTRHAGTIDIRSQPGDTEFVVRFPAGI